MINPPISDDLIDKAYRIHRDYIIHEDNLINHRVSWGITIQSFLIATFGFCYQKKYEIAEKIADNNVKLQKLQPDIVSFNYFLVLLAFVGIFAAFSTWRSVRAATRSILAVQQNWEKNIFFASDFGKMLPNLIGGGHPDTGPRGQWLAWSLPIFFGVFWAVIILFIYTSSTGKLMIVVNTTPFPSLSSP